MCICWVLFRGKPEKVGLDVEVRQKEPRRACVEIQVISAVVPFEDCAKGGIAVYEEQNSLSPEYVGIRTERQEDRCLLKRIDLGLPGAQLPSPQTGNVSDRKILLRVSAVG